MSVAVEDHAALVARWRADPAASPFQHPDVCMAVADAFGLETRVWTSGSASALAYERRVGLGPLRTAVLALPQLVPVSAPLRSQAASEADTHRGDTDLAALLHQLAAHYAQATFALPSSWRDPRTFAWADWTVEARFTYRVDLPADPGGWSAGRRRDAASGDVEVRVDADPPQRAAEMQAEAYRRKGVPFGPTVEQMTRVAQAVQATGGLRTVTARRDGAIEAAALFALGGSRATYWLSGSRPGPAMAVLMAHAFDQLAAEGARSVDLNGANVPGVAEFKRQFGATLVPRYRVRHIGPRWLRAAQALRR